MRHLAQLDFAGPDAAPFLQGYLTADLEQLEPGRALPMALTNLKGRVIASGWVGGESDRVRLFVHPTVTAILSRELGKYLLFAKSKLTQAQTGLGLSGDPSPDSLELSPVGYHVTPGTSDEGHAAFAEACVNAGFVLVAEAIAGSFLPQMIGLTAIGAVSFAKGCYLGQEVVARAEHRGQVKQQLRRYRFDGGGPALGADVTAGPKKIGTVAAVGSSTVLAAVRSNDSPVFADGCRLAISA
ncbi:MAG: hypothetical protein OXK76_03320 [Gammaproteobacteria bacterium]|nr:hypothetical protein [Gammaproteobacteria bacterium]